MAEHWIACGVGSDHQLMGRACMLFACARAVSSFQQKGCGNREQLTSHHLHLQPELTGVARVCACRGTLRNAVLDGMFQPEAHGGSRRRAMLALVRTAREVAMGM